MIPNSLKATDQLHITLGEKVECIPLCRPLFNSWTGETVDRFGNKDLLLVDGKPQFAEVAILRAFENEGWKGRWTEVYGHMHAPAFWREWKAGGPGAQEHIPIAEAWVNEKLQAIAKANGGNYAGCWDVVAWRGERLVFAEAKLQKKDKMRDTQFRWLEAALQCGCAMEDFLVVEWCINEAQE